MVAIAALTLASCTKEQNTNNNGQTPITFSSNVAGVDVNTKAPVNENTAFHGQVVGGTMGTFAAMTTPAIDADVSFAAYTSGNFGAGNYTPTTTSFYSGLTFYDFIGYAPVASATAVRSTNKVAFTVTGAEDVMLSNKVNANKATIGGVKLTFQHLLSQLQFKVVAQDAAAVAAWGTVSKIEIVTPQATKLDLDLDGGTLVANATPVNAIFTPLTGTTVVIPEVTPSAIVATSMILPTTGAINLIVYTSVTGTTTGQAVTIPAASLVKGTAYEITLKFKATAIAASANVAAWTTGATTSIDVQ